MKYLNMAILFTVTALSSLAFAECPQLTGTYNCKLKGQYEQSKTISQQTIGAATQYMFQVSQLSGTEGFTFIADEKSRSKVFNGGFVEPGGWSKPLPITLKETAICSGNTLLVIEENGTAKIELRYSLQSNGILIAQETYFSRGLATADVQRVCDRVAPTR